MMDVWHTAAEWAAMELPGLPVTKSGFIRRARDEAWATRQREASGGGLEYPLAALPESARKEYVRRQISVIDVPLAVAQTAAEEQQAEGIEPSAAEQRDARLAVLAALDRFAADAGIPRRQADELFCAAYGAAAIPVASWVRAAVKSITPRTLFRWRAARKAGATHRLAVDKGAARRGRGVLDVANEGAVKATLLAAIAKKPHIAAEALQDLIVKRFGADLSLPDGQLAPLPSVRTFQLAIKGWRVIYAAELLHLTNPDAFKDRRRVSGRRAHLVSRPNELWMIDASPADVLTKDGRHSIYVAIDVFTRRIIITVSKTPTASAVGLLIRRAVIEWGVPERIKTDNGSDFVAHFTRRVMLAIGIEIDPADPFSPEQKGVVERAIGTVQHDLMETLPGYVGHSVADRKAIEGRKAFAQRLGRDEDAAFEVDLTAIELQRYCDDWAAHVYATRPHAGLGKRTPFEVAATAGDTIRRVETKALDMLLAPIAGRKGRRTVGKEGLKIGHTIYITAGVMPGTEVFVRHDPADLGRVLVFAIDGETFLGEGIAPELAGVDPAEAVARAQAAQREHMKAGIAELKKVKFAPRDFIDARIERGKSRSAALIAFPKREEIHTTPALAAAAEAASPPVPVPVAESVIEMHRRLLAEENVTPIRREETSHDRWKRVGAIAARLQAGQPVNPDDLIWLGGYREGSEFKGFAMTYGDPLEKENPAEAGW